MRAHSPLPRSCPYFGSSIRFFPPTDMICPTGHRFPKSSCISPNAHRRSGVDAEAPGSNTLHYHQIVSVKPCQAPVLPPHGLWPSPDLVMGSTSKTKTYSNNSRFDGQSPMGVEVFIGPLYTRPSCLYWSATSAKPPVMLSSIFFWDSLSGRISAGTPTTKE